MLATLCFAAVLSLSLSSYLAVCYRSLYLSSRDMDSSRSLQLAENGIEECLWSLTSNTWTGWSTAGSTATKTINTFTYESGVTGQVTLTITNYNLTTANFTTTVTPQITLTAVGKITLGDGTTTTRTLQSDVKPTQLFTNALGASSALSFASGGTVDSYDSSVGNYSAATKTYAAVLSGGTVDIGTAQISGYVSTDGTTLQNQSAAKVIGPTTPGGTNIDLSRVSNMTSQPALDPVAPTGGSYLYDPNTSSTMLTSSVTLNTAGVYRLDYINLSGSNTLTISAPVVLKVRYWVQTAGSAQIHITSGGSLQLQIDENNGYGIYLQGGGIVNDTLQAQKVSVLVGRSYSGASASVITTTTPFYGSMYLPNDTVNVSSNFTMYGAMVGKNIAYASGYTPTVHYDTALQRIGISGFDSHAFSLVLLREV